MTDAKPERLAHEYLTMPECDQAAFNDLVLHPDQLPTTADSWQPLTMFDAYQPKEPIRFVVDDLFEYGSLNILYGPPGTLKSFLMQDLAACVVSGKPWLTPAPWGGGGCTKTTTKTSVIWLDFDMGARRALERFAALGKHYGLPQDSPLTLYSMPNPPLNAGDPVHIDLLATRAAGAGLIVIDNLRTISAGIDENASEMGQVMFNLRWLAEITGAAVVVIHHERKSNGFNSRAGDALRGHSSIEAAVDLALRIEREPYSDLITIRSTKTRGLEVLPFSATFHYAKDQTGALTEACFYSIESEDNESNYAIEREIKDALTNNPMNQSSLWEAVHARLDGVGKNRIIDQIHRLENAGEIAAQISHHNAKIYMLPVSVSQFPGASLSFPGNAQASFPVSPPL